MTAGLLAARRARLLAAGLAFVVAGSLQGCQEVEESSSAGYEPAKLRPVGKGDLKRVTFTAEGARRIGLRTALVRRSGGRAVVPYSALLYDGTGAAFVYTSPAARTFLRRNVVVDRIEGERVLLSDGPPTGTAVVTVGAAQVYGAEADIAGGH